MIDWVSVKQRLHDSESVANKALASEAERLATVCRQRAVRLAARAATTATAATVPMLVFGLYPEQYGVELRCVMQVMPFADCTPIPGAPASLLGVINLRGEIRSVVDLARLLNLPEVDRPDGHVMLIRHNETVIGIKVDRLDKIERIATESLRRASHDGGESAAPFVQGVTAEGVIVLEVSQLLSHPIFANESSKREQESPC